MKSFSRLSLMVMAGLLTSCTSNEPPAPTPIPVVEYFDTPTLLPDPAPAQNATASKKTTSSSSEPASQQWTPSRSDMRVALQDYGSWSTTPDYGEVWMPSRVSADWRPYTNGHWVHADEGWLWQASEPWGWLPYHYGHWVFLTRPARWVWVPGVEWVPAQVVWRADDQYVAWAPRPPGRVEIDVIPPLHWIVVPTPRFLEPRLTVHVVPPVRVAPIVVRTPVVTVTRRVGPSVLYVGPQVTVVTGWGVRVPPPVHVSVWRNEVPVRYKVHYDNGLHKGWYKTSVVAPPPPRGTVVVAPAPPPPRGSVKVEHRGRGGRVEVEAERNRRGTHKELEIEGPRRELEIEANRGRRGGSIEVEAEGPRGEVEIEVDGKAGRRVKIDAEREKRRKEREKHKKQAEKDHK